MNNQVYKFKVKLKHLPPTKFSNYCMVRVTNPDSDYYGRSGWIQQLSWGNMSSEWMYNVEFKRYPRVFEFFLDNELEKVENW